MSKLDLTSESRKRILERFPPRFERIMADHITIVGSEGVPDCIRIVGYQAGDGIEAAVVELDGTTERPDGSIYHVTLSFEPTKHKPQDSNTLLKEGWSHLHAPFKISIEPHRQWAV